MTLSPCSVDLIREQFIFLEINLVYPGLVSTMAILCLVALGKLLANRASVRNTLTTWTTTLINTQHHLELDNAFDQYKLQVARVERVRQILGGQLGTAGAWADKLLRDVTYVLDMWRRITLHDWKERMQARPGSARWSKRRMQE